MTNADPAGGFANLNVARDWHAAAQLASPLHAENKASPPITKITPGNQPDVLMRSSDSWRCLSRKSDPWPQEWDSFPLMMRHGFSQSGYGELSSGNSSAVKSRPAARMRSIVSLGGGLICPPEPSASAVSNLTIVLPAAMAVVRLS